MTSETTDLLVAGWQFPLGAHLLPAPAFCVFSPGAEDPQGHRGRGTCYASQRQRMPTLPHEPLKCEAELLSLENRQMESKNKKFLHKG